MVAGLDNIKWWHRIIERKDFYINGFTNHYPDFMVMTTKGNVILIETKGDFLANEETFQKLRLGKAWQEKAGGRYRYFMVFKHRDLNITGAYTVDDFTDIIKRL